MIHLVVQMIGLFNSLSTSVAPLEDWDVAIGAGDLGVSADEAPYEPLRISPADMGGVAAGQDDRDLAAPAVTPFSPRAPSASLWLRPPRRRWTPRAAVPVPVALDDPAPVAAAPSKLPHEAPVVGDGPIRDGAPPAVQALTPAQPVDADAA